MQRLKDKVALVTGGGSGIGRAIAELFKKEGAVVIATDIAATSEVWRQDVTLELDWATTLQKVEQLHGGLDVLVNCAGILGGVERQDVKHCSLELWRRVMAVNLEGVFLGCRAALPAFEKRGSGSIINISSITASMGTPQMVAYGASKAAVSQLTKSVALQCAHKNSKIRCNSIAPGAIKTPIWHSHFGENFEMAEKALSRVIPMKHFGLPHDVALAALYLASSESSFVTGMELQVDGGQGVLAVPQ